MAAQYEDHLEAVTADLRSQGKMIVSLEANQESIRDAFSKFTSDQMQHNREMAQALSSLNEKISNATITRWDNIWQAAAVALPIMGFFYFLLSGQIEDSEAILAKHMSDGHPQSVVEKVEGVRGLVGKMQVYLTRMVPRSEHEKQWESERRELDHFRDFVVRELNQLDQRITRKANEGRDDLDKSDELIFEKLNRGQ